MEAIDLDLYFERIGYAGARSKFNLDSNVAKP